MKTTKTALATVIATLALACGGAPADDDATSTSAIGGGRHDELFGLDAADELSGAQLAALGARRVRVPLRASDANAEARLRARIDELRPHGVKVALQIDYDTVPGFKDARGKDAAYAAYVGRFAARAGALAAEFGGDVSTIQIWNEQDFGWHPPPKTNGVDDGKGSGACVNDPSYDPCVPPQEFAKLLDAAVDAIKTASPNARVITGGFSAPRAQRQAYLLRVFGTMRNASRLAGLGYHQYANIAAGGSAAFDCTHVPGKCQAADLAGDVERMQTWSKTSLPIFIDEWGMFSPLFEGTPDAARKRDQVLADQIIGFFEIVGALGDRVGGASFYSYSDGAANSLKGKPTALNAYLTASKQQ